CERNIAGGERCQQNVVFACRTTCSDLCGRFVKAEQERGPDFVRLANALSALYPKDSEEKRLLDAMLLAVSR
ncbi:MAG TPA: hypothetical protein VEO92_04295, partial [Candidatus Nitrosocosmicus sp.]|nr:hypothetical protein [Candidatus Nitrosocosmicus sp.]